MAEEPPALLQPRPRRAYDLTPTSTNSSSASSLSRRPSDSSRNDPDPFTEKASRTRSILNLTSSTLFGIYTPLASGFETNRSEPSTPAGNGSQTPGKASTDDSRPPIIGPYVTAPPRTTDIHPHPHETGFWGKVFLLSERIILLFLFGMAYGVIITHLRDSQQVVPVQFDLRGIKHHSWGYLIGWGGIGVSLGALLPWVDVLWEEVLGNSIEIFPSSRPSERPVSPKDPSEKEERQTGGFSSGLGADWNPVVRSIGAFIGIAFAIRKLPWQSTSQISLTLALVNPVLWYLVDRSKPGFLLSMFVGLAGAAIAFGVNPEIVPSPAAPSLGAGSTSEFSSEYGMHDGLITNESIGLGTWIASVLFCSSVCFGNIGRRLPLGTMNRRSSVS